MRHCPPGTDFGEERVAGAGDGPGKYLVARQGLLAEEELELYFPDLDQIALLQFLRSNESLTIHSRDAASFGRSDVIVPAALVDDGGNFG